MTDLPAPASTARLDRMLLVTLFMVAAVQAYAARDTLTTDGVSYLDLAGRLRDRDWLALLDRYWSPLYPAFLALATAASGGARDLEPRIAHAVNLAIFAAALALFRGSVQALRLLQTRHDRSWVIDARTAHGTVILYALFACGALRYSNVGLVTPDLCVLVVLLAVAWAILRARAGAAAVRDDVGYGAILALGYAAKAVMLPLAVPALAAYGIARRSHGLAGAARAASALLLLAAPYVVLLSNAEGRFTTGEAGPINLAWYVAGVSSQLPDPHATGTERIERPWRRVLDSPATYVFPEPASGTYPAWADPARWQRGLQAPLTFPAVGRSVRRQLGDYYVLFGPLVLCAVLIVMVHARGGPGDGPGVLALGMMAASAVGLYAVVHLEPRFFGGIVIIAGLALSLAVTGRALPRWGPAITVAIIATGLVWRWPVAIPSLREALAGAIAAFGVSVWMRFRADGAGTAPAFLARAVVLAVLLAPVVGHVAHDARSALAVARGTLVDAAPAVAAAIRAAGIGPDTPVGSIGASTPAAWGRRAGVTIVAEVASRDTGAFFRGAAATQDAVLEKMAQAGAHAVVARSTAPPGTAWRRVRETDYWVLVLSGAPSMR